jgi:LysR family glycine cleavage system transcriptional activator
MQPLTSKLPPLKSIVAFEASARHLSLTLAAKELGVTREAVSRQIRLLEEYLGVKVFFRLHRAIALTPAGQKLQPVVRKCLQDLAYTTGEIRRPNQPYKITVSSPIATASFWLTPRLSRFRATHPNVEIHVAISDTPRDLIKDEIDIGLQYGDGHWPGLAAQRLFEITSFPICTPEYLANSAPLETPADLLNHNLINLDGQIHAAEDWMWWLKGHDVKVPKTFKMLGFDSYDNVIQVVKDGQGIALGYSSLTAELLEQGKLVRPLDAELSNDLAVYLVIPKSIKPTTQVTEFMGWILQEAASREHSTG